MKLHLPKLAWAATGILALGPAASWSAPAFLHNFEGVASGGPVGGRLFTTSASTTPVPGGAAPNYRAIVAQNQAAVVGISTKGEAKVSSEQFDFGELFGKGPSGDENRPFYRFFRGVPNSPGNAPIHGQGSGFVVSSDGLILTHAHVVDGAKEVTVKLADHREFKAKVLGADHASDIALLKIDAHDLSTVRLGNSDRLRVGDYVLAIGAPFGLEETATAGIVSAMGRSLPGDGYVPFIQTDAAVNPGNSGGPLFDATGAVVGINSQIYSNSGGYQGVAFAIPINLAEQVEQQIVKTGKVAHGRLGVEVQSIDQSLADSFKLGSPSGALVSKVQPGSAAAAAGLQVGDVILKYNGSTIADASQLSTRVNTTTPGETASLEIWRNGAPITLTARVGSADTLTAGDHGRAPSEPTTRLGLALRPLTKQESDQAGVSNGLVVENAEGHAAAAGIRPGDLVLGVDGTPVKSAAQLNALALRHDRQVALLIQRGDSRLFIPISLG